MLIRCTTLCGATLIALCMTVAAPADEPTQRVFGEGVHAYFDGRMNEADAKLTAAIEAGFKDPRALYFRGLVLARLGKLEASTADFKAAAAMEAQNQGQARRINSALERVQGAIRLRIESIRAQARVDLADARREREVARYGRPLGQSEAIEGDRTDEGGKVVAGKPVEEAPETPTDPFADEESADAAKEEPAEEKKADDSADVEDLFDTP